MDKNLQETLNAILLNQVNLQNSITELQGQVKKLAQQRVLFMESDVDEDDLFEDAKQAVVEAGKASTSFLQRKFSIGYSRAARLMDLLEEGGVVSPQVGTAPGK